MASHTIKSVANDAKKTILRITKNIKKMKGKKRKDADACPKRDEKNNRRHRGVGKFDFRRRENSIYTLNALRFFSNFHTSQSTRNNNHRYH